MDPSSGKVATADYGDVVVDVDHIMGRHRAKKKILKLKWLRYKIQNMRKAVVQTT